MRRDWLRVFHRTCIGSEIDAQSAGPDCNSQHLYGNSVSVGWDRVRKERKKKERERERQKKKEREKEQKDSITERKKGKRRKKDCSDPR